MEHAQYYASTGHLEVYCWLCIMVMAASIVTPHIPDVDAFAGHIEYFCLYVPAQCLVDRAVTSECHAARACWSVHLLYTCEEGT